MKNIWLLFLLIPILSYSQNLRLSNEAEIHVLTCGPYQGELYSAFGHSAIRVKDPKSRYDILYNYGVFDFDQPNFYLNFARGYLNYKLGVTDYSHFRDYYIYYNRYIHEQVLNLSQEQKQQLFDFLQWNSKPENQYYYYDYFYDNCATRVRDALVKTFGDSVQFDGSYIDTDYTIRDLTDIYLQEQPWGDLGIDICLGLPMDKEATPFEYMFLPDYVEQAFNHATILKNGERVPLVKQTLITYASTEEKASGSILTPFLVFSVLLLFGALITYKGYQQKRLYAGFDVVLFTVIGLIGWLLLLLWVATDHAAAAKNFNLLWAVPFHVPMVFFLLKKQKTLFLKNFYLAISILSAMLLLVWVFLPQHLHVAFIPFVMLIGMRAYYIQLFIKNEKA